MYLSQADTHLMVLHDLKKFCISEYFGEEDTLIKNVDY